MKKVLIYICSIFLFAQIATANTEIPVKNLTAPVRYGKVPLRFKSYSSYLQYISIKAFKGVDSANAFYKKEIENAAYNYTDYLPLTAGSGTPLTGTLYSSSTTIFQQNSGGTAHVEGIWHNDGNNTYVGIASSTGSFFTGSTAYSSQFGNTENASLQLATNNTVRMTIDGSGNVGIGTTSPNSVLDISYNHPTTNVGFKVNDDNGYGVYVSNENTLNFNYGHNGNDIGYINNLGYNNGTTRFRDLEIDNGKGSLVAYFDGVNQRVGIGTTAPSYPFEIAANVADWGFATQNANANGYGAFIKGGKSDGTTSALQVNNQAGTGLFTIKGNGNVGIGTSSPVYNLDVRGATPIINVTPSTGTDYGGYRLSNNANTSFFVAENSAGGGVFSGSIAYATVLGNFSNVPLQFGTNTTVKMTILSGGNVGIGTTSPSEKLSVNGNISTKKLIVTQTGWSDYVFNKNYKLRSLQNLETYINQNKHLPEVPTAKEVESKGISVGDNQALLLKKIEELTLYVIDQQKQINELRKQARKK